MYYTPTMQSAIFETEKNRKAFIYTAIICAVILLLAFFITWPVLKVAPTPVSQDLIEIDLGAAEGPIMETMGGGGSPSSSNATPINNEQEDDAVQQDASDDDDAEAAPVIKNPRPSISKTPAKTPVKDPSPKYQMAPVKNSNNTNGDTYKSGSKPGPGDGPLDGPGGGGGGAGGTVIGNGLRPLNLGSLRFEDDFSENAKVYIAVRYNSNGSFASASVVKPTTTTNATILRIARQKVSALKFPATPDGGVTTILLNFKIQN